MGFCTNFNNISGGKNRTSGANCLCQVWGKHISPTKGRKTELNCRFYCWNHKQDLDYASIENTLDPDTGVYIYFIMPLRCKIGSPLKQKKLFEEKVSKKSKLNFHFNKFSCHACGRGIEVCTPVQMKTHCIDLGTITCTIGPA